MGLPGARTVFGVALSLTAGAMGALMAATLPACATDLRIPGVQAEPLTFAALDGWQSDDHAAAFGAFLKSCKSILHMSAATRAARPIYGGLYKACQHAAAAGRLDRDKARAFFESNFRPVRLIPNGEQNGFFTGYYETVIEGARKHSAEYNVPIYKMPGSAALASADRSRIEAGLLAGKGLEICWLKNPVDAFFAQIQGSARVKLAGGETIRIGYAGRNGLPYTAVGKFLIDRGIYTREEMSMDKIRSWMEANPEEGRELRLKNRSYVFFRETPLHKDEHSTGGQGVELTPLHSIAIDRSIHAYGTPVWIEAELPIASEKPETPFRHLTIAQDTGTAIVGPARADIFFGSGEDIGLIAGRIKQFGRFVMLVPNGVTLVNAPAPAPVPKPRP
jgi:membrane-bound lytic murein transglycosylase A